MMPAMESRSPSYTNGQGNMPRRQDENRFLSSSPSGNHYLPNDDGSFAFSAEPVIMNYTTMGALHSTESTENSVFTPNTGSSYDSLHPDVINQSYAHQPNQYVQHQMQHLAGNSAPHSLSPSVNSLHDHVSPDGYLSDSIYQDYSQYTTPGFGDPLLENPLLETQLGSLLHISETNQGSPYAGSYHGSSSMLGVDANSMRGFNQGQPSLSSARSDSHLLSPSLTSNSSPVIGDESANNLTVAAIRLTGNEFQPQSTPSPAMSSSARSNPHQQQHSPALTNSPGGPGAGGVSLANPQPRAPHLTSPIVRVENYSRGESPARSDISRTMSKRSHGSRRSGTHLSPYPVDDSSDDDMEEEPPPVRNVSVAAERREDGSWLADNSSGQAGLSPADRDAMKDIYVPTIEEVAEQRLIAEKKAEVQDWLTKSEVGSEAGDIDNDALAIRRKHTTNRRRAKSHNDASVRQTLGSSLGLGVRTVFDDSGIPGPGVYVDERSEMDEDEEEDEEDYEPESPPAQIEVAGVEVETSYFPSITQNEVAPEAPVGTRPWNDVPFQPEASGDRYQPPTSNAAMMRFHQRAKDIESASLAATIGSRRVSESDLGSLYAAGGVSKLITSDVNQAKPKDKSRDRRPSFLDNILPKRTVSNNVLKRKGSHPIAPPQAPDSAIPKVKEPQPLLEKPKRIGSWGRPKSPRLDTSVAQNTRDVGPPGSGNLSATSGPWAHAKNAIRRSRSRSDLGKSPGLAELMTQHGGPPMLTLASPLADAEATKNSPLPSPGGDEDENNMDDEGLSSEAVIMDLKVRSDPIIPTYEGFKTHARQLNPRLVDYMVERITQEQMRRYKRLLEFRVKHLNAVKNKKCASTKEFCVALGGDSKLLPPRAGNKDSDAPFIGFQITAPGASDDDGEAAPEGTVVSAQFPQGVPLPPVKRLPAEFECPLCFKVKKFYKPSDWTKHVHEDVQPFTCTFPNCGEPKSFKRKADWVRHENERHRQLENWTCSVADCNHTCYRKDNFVQHLVREHKIAEPRARTGRSGNTSARDTSAHPDNAWSGGFPGGSQTSKDPSDDVWALVEKCRQDTTKQPKDEPCRFCGNILNSWKKLTVHLAKHMEQISMPILPLVEQKQLNADTIISPVVEMPEHSRNQLATPIKSPNDNPSRYNPGSTMPHLGAGFDPATYAQYSSEVSQSSLTAPAMHSYPPPQFPYRGQQQQQNPSFSFPIDQPQSFAVRSYPGLLDTRQRSPQGNGAQSSNQAYRGNMQNGAGQYAPITPVSATYGQPQVFSSPVDTTPYSNEIPSAYFTNEPQSIVAAPQAGLNGNAHLGYDQSSGVPYSSAGYQQIPQYMQQQQQNYPYQGQ